jgi:hypothetical protein
MTPISSNAIIFGIMISCIAGTALVFFAFIWKIKWFGILLSGLASGFTFGVIIWLLIAIGYQRNV